VLVYDERKRPRDLGRMMTEAQRELLLALEICGRNGLRLTSYTGRELAWLVDNRLAIQRPSRDNRWYLTRYGKRSIKSNTY
jgi:hypothetical protein